MIWATPILASQVCHGRVGRAAAGRTHKAPGTAATAVAHSREPKAALNVRSDTPVDTLLLDDLRRRGLVR